MNIREGVKRIYIAVSVLVFLVVVLLSVTGNTYPTRGGIVQRNVDGLKYFAKAFPQPDAVAKAQQDGELFWSISEMQPQEMEKAYKQTSFSSPLASGGCSLMTTELGSLNYYRNGYWFHITIGPIAVVVLSFLFWKVFSWIGAGFTRKTTIKPPPEAGSP